VRITYHIDVLFPAANIISIFLMLYPGILQSCRNRPCGSSQLAREAELSIHLLPYACGVISGASRLNQGRHVHIEPCLKGVMSAVGYRSKETPLQAT
jgi:hypothetical protein